MSWAAWPVGLKPSGISWRLSANTQIHTSPLDGSTQTLRLPGARWIVSYSWADMPVPEWRMVDAFVSWLGGRAGRFTLTPAHHAPRRGAGGGTPVISGAEQSGENLVTRGWPANTVVLRAGDYISYPDAAARPMLHKVATWEVISDGSGNATMTIAPPIRRPGADGAPIEVNTPVGLFRLASDDEGELVLRKPVRGAISVNMEEALV